MWIFWAIHSISTSFESALTNSGIQIDVENIVTSLPSADSIKDAVTEYAVDTTLLMKDSIDANPIVYLAYDKGNKKGNKNLAKYLCWYCKKTKKNITFLLNVDCVDVDIKDIFTGIHHSL